MNQHHPIMQRAAFLGSGAVIGALLAAHTTSAQLTPTSCTKAHTTHTTHTTVARRAGTPRYVVDAQTGMSVQAWGLRTDRGGDFPPPAGHVYLVAHVLIHNGGRAPHAYNPFDFTLHVLRDQIDYQPDAIDTQVHQLVAGTLAPGASVAGDLAFQ